MKIIITFFWFIAGIQTAFAQKTNVDSILQKVTIERNEDNKFDLLIGLIGSEINNSPEWCIETGLKVLNQSRSENSNIELTVAYSFFGSGI
ncbi:MAG: hypothetical protein IPP79_19235 [Chitinophagaceae bacterium]|nr:hypothetical protein [Chitinophagaceae bacterium]